MGVYHMALKSTTKSPDFLRQLILCIVMLFTEFNVSIIDPPEVARKWALIIAE
jgi:hypothetical protein